MELGGSLGRREATGRGCMIVTLEALKLFGLRPEDTRVVIQGFGNVGGMAARLMAAQGFRIICIIEYDGAVYNPHGLNIEALMRASRRDRLDCRISPAARTWTSAKRCFSNATCCCRPRLRM